MSRFTIREPFFHISQGLFFYLAHPLLWSFIVIAIGAVGIFGWVITSLPLISVFSSTTPIAPNTAFLFLFLGIALGVCSLQDQKNVLFLVRTILCLFSLLIAGITILDIAFGYPAHIDYLLITQTLSSDYSIGHMSPVTALLFLALASGILSWQRYRQVARYLGGGISLTGGVMILGYLYGAPFLYGGSIIPVAFLTAIGFLSAGICLYLLSESETEKLRKQSPTVKDKILSIFVPYIAAILVIEGYITTFLLHKVDNTFVLAVSLFTLLAMCITILLSHVFSRVIAADIDLANARRALAEQELQDSLTRLTISAKIAGLGFWTWDFSTDQLIWDTQTYLIHGIEPGTPLTIYQWADLIHPEDRPDSDRIRSMKKQKEFHSEFRIIDSDEATRYIEGHGVVLFSPDGIPERMIGINWDITSKISAIDILNRQKEELNAANEELESQSEELTQQFRDLVGANDAVMSARLFTEEVILQAGEGIVVLGPDGVVITWNRFMEEFTGYDAGSVVGRRFLSVFPGLPDIGMESYLSRAFGGEMVLLPDTHLLNPVTGDERWFTATCSPHQDAHGDIIGVIITIRDSTDRRRFEYKLKQSEALLRSSQALARIGGWEYNVETREMFWTDQTYEIHEVERSFDTTASDTYIQISLSCYREEDRKMVLNAFNRCINEGTPYMFEFPFTTYKGNHIWIRTQGQAQWVDGKIIAVYGTIMDITREKKVIAELERERLSLREILDHMPDGAYMVDAGYHVRYTNPVMLSLFGNPEHKHCYEYVHNRTTPCPWCQNERVFKGESVRWEWEDPQTGHVYDLFDTPYTNPDGEIFKLEFFHDITDLRKTERSLAETNEYLSRLIEYANVPIIVWDNTSIVRKFNYASEILSGYTRNEIIGQPFHILFPSSHLEQVIGIFNTGMKNGRLYEYEIAIKRPDGTLIPVIWNAAEISDEKGNLRAIIAQGRDVTRERLLEREKAVALRQIQRNFSELAILNDGIRNPLMVISMVTEMHCPTIFETIDEQISLIDQIVTKLDSRWTESESVINFLHRHYAIPKINDYSQSDFSDPTDLE